MTIYQCWSTLDGAKAARETAGTNARNAAENHALIELERQNTHGERAIVIAVKSPRGDIKKFEVIYKAKVTREVSK